MIEYKYMEFQMKRKILLSLFLGTMLSATTQIHASSGCQIGSGAYVGLSAGLANLSGKRDYTDSTDGGAGPQVIQQQAKFGLSKTSAAAALFAGYGMKIGSAWTAAELFYQFDRLKDKDSIIFQAQQTPKNLESSSTGAYGAAVHLGFIPTNGCTAYAILGVESRRFKVKFSDPVPANISAVINKSYRSFAFVPGVGVRFALCKNLSLRTEYKYAMHRNKKLTNSNLRAGQTDIVTIKHQPKVHSFNVGLVYTF